MSKMTAPSSGESPTGSYYYTIRYAILGAAFGLLFPIVATLIFVWESGAAFTLQAFVEAQLNTPLLWIIDTAPLFLGLFAAFAGQREDRLQIANRQLVASVESLEVQVEGQARELDRAVEVSHSINQVSDLDQMLAEAAELIRASFDLYYAQVYLLDVDVPYLTLRAGTGEAGQTLVRQNWRLPMDAGSIVGTAAQERQAILVTNTATSQSFHPNPMLPNTLSEVAMPLLIGQRVVGVLDLQSSQANQLTEHSLPALEAVAGQLAIAIEHARLMEEATEARNQVEAQARRMAGRGWQEFLNAVDRGEVLGYTFDAEDITPIQEPLPVTIEDHDLHVPIIIAGQTVGMVRVAGAAEHHWSKNESELVTSVAEQVARQVENLRLLAEADQYRAEAEEATRRLIREGWESYRLDHAAEARGYIYDRTRVVPMPAEPDPDRHDIEGGPAAGPESRLTRPLQVRGQDIGWLEVVRPAGADEATEELVDAVAAQLSTHLENLRLTEQRELALAEIEEQAGRLATLNRLSENLANAATLDEVYRIAAAQIGGIVPADRLSLAVRAEDGSTFEILALDPEAGAINIGRLESVAGTVVGMAFDENRVINVGQTRDGAAAGIGSFLVAPLAAGGQSFGTINAGSNQRHAFTIRDERLLLQAASLIAATLESRRLFAEIQQRAEELAVISQMAQLRADELAILNEMGQALTSLADVDTVINIVYEHTLRLVGTEGFYAALHDAQSNSVTIHIVDEEDGKATDSLGRVGVRAITEHIISSGQPLLIKDNMSEHIRELGIEALGPMPVSWLGVPMISGNEVIGVLAVQSFDQEGLYDEHHQELLTAVANQAAIAIENARLFDQVQARAKREQILREITAQVRGKADVDTIMRTAAQEVGRALGRQSFVYLREDDQEIGQVKKS
ncbi:MAG TPA: GAF domain-containing protein [Anaerolineae bacterium]|nr:GAF domain-containing protein [Anaerolineae bacterium]